MLNYLVPSVIHIDSSIWYCTTEFYVPLIIIFQGYIITLQLTVLCATESRTTITTVVCLWSCRFCWSVMFGLVSWLPLPSSVTLWVSQRNGERSGRPSELPSSDIVFHKLCWLLQLLTNPHSRSGTYLPLIIPPPFALFSSLRYSYVLISLLSNRKFVFSCTTSFESRFFIF
jgi:hypothetical protein